MWANWRRSAAAHALNEAGLASGAAQRLDAARAERLEGEAALLEGQLRDRRVSLTESQRRRLARDMLRARKEARKTELAMARRHRFGDSVAQKASLLEEVTLAHLTATASTAVRRAVDSLDLDGIAHDIQSDAREHSHANMQLGALGDTVADLENDERDEADFESTEQQVEEVLQQLALEELLPSPPTTRLDASDGGGGGGGPSRDIERRSATGTPPLINEAVEEMLREADARLRMANGERRGGGGAAAAAVAAEVAAARPPVRSHVPLPPAKVHPHSPPDRP